MDSSDSSPDRSNNPDHRNQSPKHKSLPNKPPSDPEPSKKSKPSTSAQPDEPVAVERPEDPATRTWFQVFRESVANFNLENTGNIAPQRESLMQATRRATANINIIRPTRPRPVLRPNLGAPVPSGQPRSVTPGNSGVPVPSRQSRPVTLANLGFLVPSTQSRPVLRPNLGAPVPSGQPRPVTPGNSGVPVPSRQSRPVTLANLGFLVPSTQSRPVLRQSLGGPVSSGQPRSVTPGNSGVPVPSRQSRPVTPATSGQFRAVTPANLGIYVPQGQSRPATPTILSVPATPGQFKVVRLANINISGHQSQSRPVTPASVAVPGSSSQPAPMRLETASLPRLRALSVANLSLTGPLTGPIPVENMPKLVPINAPKVDNRQFQRILPRILKRPPLPKAGQKAPRMPIVYCIPVKNVPTMIQTVRVERQTQPLRTYSKGNREPKKTNIPKIPVIESTEHIDLGAQDRQAVTIKSKTFKRPAILKNPESSQQPKQTHQQYQLITADFRRNYLYDPANILQICWGANCNNVVFLKGCSICHLTYCPHHAAKLAHGCNIETPGQATFRRYGSDYASAKIKFMGEALLAEKKFPDCNCRGTCRKCKFFYIYMKYIMDFGTIYKKK